MPPSVALESRAATLALPEPAPVVAGLWFGSVPITETGAFPPAAQSHCWIYLTLNAEIALSLRANPSLQNLVANPRARISVDGQWLWWALRRKYPAQALKKLSGSDLIYELAAHGAANGRRLLLLGSTPELNAAAVLRLRERHPGLAVAGFAPPNFGLGDDSAEDRVVQGALEAIAAFRPDYVVLGLGAEKEQRLAARLAPAVDGRVTGVLCFGGAIDMASGEVRRAPRWMQRGGVEALYRVWEQPARLPRLLRALRVLPPLLLGRY